jgi:ankyrin repeat protein
MCVCVCVYEQVMKFLVEKGANPDVKDNFGITPLLAAVYEVRG